MCRSDQLQLVCMLECSGIYKASFVSMSCMLHTLHAHNLPVNAALVLPSLQTLHAYNLPVNATLVLPSCHGLINLSQTVLLQ